MACEGFFETFPCLTERTVWTTMRQTMHLHPGFMVMHQVRLCFAFISVRSNFGIVIQSYACWFGKFLKNSDNCRCWLTSGVTLTEVVFFLVPQLSSISKGLFESAFALVHSSVWKMMISLTCDIRPWLSIL